MATRKKKPAPEAAPAQDAQTVNTFKGFDHNFQCRGYQFEVGKTYTHDGEVEACSSGFHACENPLDVFAYYEPGVSKFATTEQSGEISRHDSDSKIASSSIRIVAELSIAGLVTAAFEYVKSKCEPATSEHATGDSSASSATGDSSASSATGDRSASSATGDRSASSATGDSSASSATGDSSASSATGDRSASSATGYSSASSATGDRSASSATGYRSASSATGYSSASSATGYSSASLTTGSRSSSEILPADKPQHAVAIATGYESRARAPEGCALFLCERNDEGEIVNAWAGIVGHDGIEPNAWYTLVNGKPSRIDEGVNQ